MSALGAEDAAWLHMEDATNPMVVSGLLELDAPLPMTEIRRRIEERLLPNARFRSRVVESRGPIGLPRWELAPDFALERHVAHVEVADDVALRRLVGDAASTIFDRAHPLWHLHVIDRPGAGTALLCRVHHAIADGFALLAVLLSMCDEGIASPAAVPQGATKTKSGGGGVFGYASSAARLVTLPRDPKTALKGALGVQKRVAWTRPLVLAEVKSIAHETDATINDVLVAVVAGALRRYLARRGEEVARTSVRAMVPVNLRRLGEPMTGNRFGLVLLELPVGTADPRERVGVVKRRMAALKTSREPLVAMALLCAMGALPRKVEELGAAFFGQKASLVLTNVPGPRERLHFAGATIARMMFWVPQSARLGVGVSILSYAGEVRLGVIADAGLVPDPEVVVEEVHAELETLRAETLGL